MSYRSNNIQSVLGRSLRVQSHVHYFGSMYVFGNLGVFKINKLQIQNWPMKNL